MPSASGRRRPPSLLRSRRCDRSPRATGREPGLFRRSSTRLALQESSLLDGGEDIAGALADVGSTRRGRLVEVVRDPCSVASFDRGDPGNGNDRSMREVRALADVGRDASLLEQVGGSGELLRFFRRALEVERRLLPGGAAQLLLQQRDVRRLLAADNAGELRQLAAERARRHGLAIKGGLKVLEQQQEVENLRVLLLRGRRR